MKDHARLTAFLAHHNKMPGIEEQSEQEEGCVSFDGEEFKTE